MKHANLALFLLAACGAALAAPDNADVAAREAGSPSMSPLAFILGAVGAAVVGLRAWMSDGPALGVAGAAVGFALGATAGALVAIVL